MPTRCNRGFYCRSYCLLNMFRAPLCPSAVAQEYYTVVSACGISCCVFQVAGLVWSWGLCVRFAGCCSILQTGQNTHLYASGIPLFWVFLFMFWASGGAVCSGCALQAGQSRGSIPDGVTGIFHSYNSSGCTMALRSTQPLAGMSTSNFPEVKYGRYVRQHPANRTHNPQLHTRPATWKPQHEIPQAATIV